VIDAVRVGSSGSGPIGYGSSGLCLLLVVAISPDASNWRILDAGVRRYQGTRALAPVVGGRYGRG